MAESNIINTALEKALEVGAFLLVAVIVVAATQTLVGGSFIDLVQLI